MVGKIKTDHEQIISSLQICQEIGEATLPSWADCAHRSTALNIASWCNWLPTS